MVKRANPSAKAVAQPVKVKANAKAKAEPDVMAMTLGQMASPFRTLMKFRLSEQCKKARHPTNRLRPYHM